MSTRHARSRSAGAFDATTDCAASGAAGQKRLSGFGPIIDEHCDTIVLGSFPGQASLAAGHYYAHPRNQFWPMLGIVLGEPFATLSFPDRYRMLLGHRIALWDVLGACERRTSLDADIRAATANDFGLLARLGPRLRSVLFNGRAAGRFEPCFREQGYETHVLASTSPAHASVRFEGKLDAWRAALGRN